MWNICSEFIEKDTNSQRCNWVEFLENPKETRATVFQRKINILKQEIVFRNTYPGRSRQSSVIRGQERTRSTSLG